MAKKNKATLIKYENLTTGAIFYGYSREDAMKKEIDGEVYMEVTSSLTRPKISWVKMEQLQKKESVTFELP